MTKRTNANKTRRSTPREKKRTKNIIRHTDEKQASLFDAIGDDDERKKNPKRRKEKKDLYGLGLIEYTCIV